MRLEIRLIQSPFRILLGFLPIPLELVPDLILTLIFPQDDARLVLRSRMSYGAKMRTVSVFQADQPLGLETCMDASSRSVNMRPRSALFPTSYLHQLNPH